MKIDKYMRLFETKKKIVVWAAIVFLGGLIFYSWYTFCSVQRFVFFNTDEFLELKRFKEAGSPGVLDYVREIFGDTVVLWNNWQGTYSFVFFAFMNWLSYISPEAGIVVRIIRTSLFFFSVIFLFRHIIKKMNGNTIEWVMVAAGLIWSFTNYKSFSQVFFWDLTIRLYMNATTWLLFALLFMYRTGENNKTIDCILSCLFAVIAMGGIQSSVLVGCYLAMTEIIKNKLNGGLNKKQIIVFSVFVIGGIMNCFAPGGFRRHEAFVSDGKLYIIKAMGWALRDDIIYSEEYFKDTPFLAVFLMFILVGLVGHIIINKGIATQVFMFFLTPEVALFPACLGYNSSYMPNRIRFIVEFWLLTRYILAAIGIGFILRQFFEKEKVFVVGCTLLVGIIISALLCQYRIEDGQIYTLQKGLSNGEIQAYKEGVERILNEIEESDSMNVVTSDVPESVEGFIVFYYNDDPSYLGNVDLKQYYGKNSVRAEGKRKYNIE